MYLEENVNVGICRVNNFHYFSVSLSLASARARDEDDSIIDSFDPVRWGF